jgi:predicted DsbA family dithiol-disulfide isomerase
MEDAMKVDVWSDVICPWCGLANYRLHEALRRFEHAGDVELVHHSFEMAPDLPGGQGISQRELLAQVGKTGQAAESYIRPIERLARRDGLVPYTVMDRMMGNTALAHELLSYATERGRGPEAWQHAYRVHFGQSRPLFDVESLLALAAEIGLDPDGAREALASRRFRDQVAQDKADAYRLGAQGVPFTVIDGRYGLSGAQEIDVFLSALRRAWNESRQPEPLIAIGDGPGGACGPEACGLPGGATAGDPRASNTAGR